jgi:hypothetical protein
MKNILFFPCDSATLANFATTGSALLFFSSEISGESWRIYEVLCYEKINLFVNYPHS